jgi:hypothetical protein
MSVAWSKISGTYNASEIVTSPVIVIAIVLTDFCALRLVEAVGSGFVTF